MAGRFVLADKEGPARERRRQSALARSCGDMVVVACWWRAASWRLADVGMAPRTYETGGASIVPVPCPYGVALGALFARYSFVVTDLFNICRL